MAREESHSGGRASGAWVCSRRQLGTIAGDLNRRRTTSDSPVRNLCSWRVDEQGDKIEKEAVAMIQVQGRPVCTRRVEQG